jgi:hypothetical protein
LGRYNITELLEVLLELSFGAGITVETGLADIESGLAWRGATLPGAGTLYTLCVTEAAQSPAECLVYLGHPYNPA